MLQAYIHVFKVSVCFHKERWAGERTMYYKMDLKQKIACVGAYFEVYVPHETRRTRVGSALRLGYGLLFHICRDGDATRRSAIQARRGCSVLFLPLR